MPEPVRAPPVPGPRPDPFFRPSEYTGALIQAIRMRSDWAAGADVLEVGCGSGVVLAALASLGAATLTGIDIEPDAVAASRALMAASGHAGRAEVSQGDMWTPVAGRRFDLIVANLPHFPMADGAAPGRRPTWSAGGPDGRRLLEPFIAGLGQGLAAGGRALMTHNAFVDIDRSRRLAGGQGLALREVLTELVFVPEEKLARITPAVLRREADRTIHAYGPYVFAEVRVVEIAAPDALA